MLKYRMQIYYLALNNKIHTVSHLFSISLSCSYKLNITACTVLPSIGKCKNSNTERYHASPKNTRSSTVETIFFSCFGLLIFTVLKKGLDLSLFFIRREDLSAIMVLLKSRALTVPKITQLHN